MRYKNFELVGHTSFIGKTGYASHSRNFFTRLNKIHPTRIRNFSHYPTLDHLTEEQKQMIIEQHWIEPPFHVGSPYERGIKRLVNIVLNETNHYYFYDNYEDIKIGYNVWESTRQPEEYFNKILEYDQFWVPTEWQRQCTIDQGYPEDKVKVVREGVDGNTFYPLLGSDTINDDKFYFLLFQRWDYRKSTTEIIKAFLEEFKNEKNVRMICSIDNSFPVDGMKSTEERLKHHGFYKHSFSKLKIIPFISDEEYINYLRTGNCLVSCSRSEGWNLPLIEAIACGTPTICSNYGAQLEFAKDHSILVDIKGMEKVKNIFMQDDDKLIGEWAVPDFDDLRKKMRLIYENYEHFKNKALESSKIIREEFSWDKPVKVAYDNILELLNKEIILVNINSNEIKLNVGCGEFKLDGYINIDKYVEADIKADSCSLPYKDNSVSEIVSSHHLEHLDIDEINKTLKEFYRILKPEGSLKLNVPNLDWCLRNFLEKNENEKWTFPLHTIFGNQNNKGEYHKTGFTKERIETLLKNESFNNIEIKDEWSHAQQCFSITCKKIDTSKLQVIAVGCYIRNEEQKEMLEKLLISLPKNIKKCVVTHGNIPDSIQELTDYVIIDQNNIVNNDWSLDFWFTKKDDVTIYYSSDKPYHGAACLSSIRNAASFFRDKYKIVHYLEYDFNSEIDLTKYFKETEHLLNSKKIVLFPYLTNYNNPSGVITNIMSFDPEWFSNTFPQINTWEEYTSLTKGSFILEDLFFRYLIEKCPNDFSILDNNFIDEYFSGNSNFNLVDAEKGLHFVLADTVNDSKVMLFVVNTNHIDESFDIIDQNTHNLETFIIPGSGYFCRLLDKTELTYYYKNKGNIVGLHDDHKARYKFDEQYITKPLSKYWKEETNYLNQNRINANVNFVGRAFLEIKQPITDTKTYRVEFRDFEKNDRVIYHADLKTNQWCSPSRKFFTIWNIVVKDGNDIVYSHKLNLNDQRVLISFDSKSLGDTIAWVPYVEEFRKKHNCKIILSTFWNIIFKDTYSDIEFVEPGTVVHNLYASYNIGCYDDDPDGYKNRLRWRSIPIQKIASDMLGLDYKELNPELKVDRSNEPEKKYVCISEHSTFKGKYWLYPNGWQNVVDYIKSLGYDVVVISKEKTELKGVIDLTNRPITETINTLKYAKLFLGVSSGPAWLAWSLNVPVIIISGMTPKMSEFHSGIHRIINKDVCNSCLYDMTFELERGNWEFCPRHNDFICTKTIKPETVIDSINQVLNKTEDLHFYVNNGESKFGPFDVRNVTDQEYPLVQSMYREIHLEKIYELEDCKIKQNDIVVDMGACIGMFARYAANLGAQKVFSFEPNYLNYACLKENVPMNCYTYNVGISGKSGSYTFYRDWNIGGHSLINSNYNSTKIGTSENVLCLSMEDALNLIKVDNVNYLKMDIEGAEYDTIMNTPIEIIQKCDKIVMEIHKMIIGEKYKELVDKIISGGYSFVIHDDNIGHTSMAYFKKK